METNLVYMTAKDMSEAKKIASAIVEEKLAACVNILPGMESIYHWQGKVENEMEVVLLAKTKSMLVAQLTDRVKELHSYDTPCVVAVSISGGNPDFLEWIAAETR